MIGNNQPGMGLGFSANKQIAHSLGTIDILIIFIGKSIYIFEYIK